MLAFIIHKATDFGRIKNAGDDAGAVVRIDGDNPFLKKPVDAYRATKPPTDPSPPAVPSPVTVPLPLAVPSPLTAARRP